MPQSLRSPRWFVAQNGAREQFAVPRAIHRAGRLAALATEIWMGPRRARVLGGLRATSRLASRWHADLGDVEVRHRSARAVLRQVLQRPPTDPRERSRRYIREGADFASWVAELLGPMRGVAGGFLGFTNASLEALERARSLGMRTVLDQIAAGRIEDRLSREEWDRHGLPAESCPQRPQDYWDRVAAEWAIADGVLVNSRWARDSLRDDGVDESRLFVVPVSHAAETRAAPIRRAPSEPLRLIFVGRVSVMKGVPDLLAAMRHLASGGRRGPRLDLYGRVELPDRLLERLPDGVRLHGAVPSSEVAARMREAHALVFPTICDGFGKVQIEAMSCGLPVLATTNCGDVVDDGVDGFRVPIRSPHAIAEGIERIESMGSGIDGFSEAALAKSRTFGLDRWWRDFEAGVDALQEGGVAS